jgi:hypothetical protein
VAFSHYEPCPNCRDSGRDSRGDNLACYRDGSAHCFSCHYHVHGGVFNRHSSKELVDHGAKSVLPFDFTREVPTHAWKWVLQYGLPYSYWQGRVGYSPAEGRLVFTVGQPVAFSIGRLVEEREGNHAARRKWYVWGNSHNHCEIINEGSDQTAPIVLVEDLISAHKVGQVATCIPLFGTNIHKPHLYYLMQAGRPVKMWLDKDQEGNVRKKALGLQALINNSVDVVLTTSDPKEYTSTQIKEILSD